MLILRFPMNRLSSDQEKQVLIVKKKLWAMLAIVLGLGLFGGLSGMPDPVLVTVWCGAGVLFGCIFGFISLFLLPLMWKLVFKRK